MTPRMPPRSCANRPSDIVLILGIEGRAEMVHRDDMVLGGA